MKIEHFLEELNADFFTGVPDSQLSALSNYLYDNYGMDPQHHVICPNEGSCVGLAAGYHLATGKVAVVYMQNSGEGNAVNPIASLINKEVYGIPMIFVVGWRGEPGIHDEPQHAFQGQITLDLLKLLGIDCLIIDSNTSREEVGSFISHYRKNAGSRTQIAFIVKKNSLEYSPKSAFKNNYPLTREEAIAVITKAAGESAIISTTGKAGRELFELREDSSQGHERDFLTVGSMGHASTIALGIALKKPDKKVICIDGDGAALMHLGAMAMIGSIKPRNLIHIIINNEAHESVGGLPVSNTNVDFTHIAGSCGYAHTATVADKEELVLALESAMAANSLSIIVVKCNLHVRKDLGRPTTAPAQNKKAFMEFLDS